VLHNSGHHPNFPTRAVLAIFAIAAAIFGTVVIATNADASPPAVPDEAARST